MNSRMTLCVAVLVGCVVASATGCSESDNPVGGPCTYATIAGTATIESVDPVDDPDELEQRSCENDPVKVRFRWDPNDSSDPNLGSYNSHRDAYTDSSGLFLLRLPPNRNPPSLWVEQEGLTPGSQHDCEVTVLTSGSCSPLKIAFTRVDYAEGLAMCD
jgi:hypothetical protein